MLLTSTVNAPEALEALVPEMERRLMDGELIAAICQDLGITRHQFNSFWTHPTRIDRYRELQGYQADALAESAVRAVDDDADVQRARLKFQARTWLAGRYNPKYGDKLDITVTERVSIAAALLEAKSRTRVLAGEATTVSEEDDPRAITLAEHSEAAERLAKLLE